jgi:hypothetical protein
MKAACESDEMPTLSNESVGRVLAHVEGLALGDRRLDARITEVVGKFAANPGATIPDIMGSEAALEAAYRAFGNEKVTFEALLEPQWATTKQLATGCERVLVLHDTTTCASAHADASEIGYLPSGEAGFFAHLGLVLDGTSWRRPLGIANAEVFSRSEKPAVKKAKEKQAPRKKLSGAQTAKQEDKESARWWRGIAAAEERLQGCRIKHIADREADSYALLADLITHSKAFIIRLKHDRRSLNADGSVMPVKTLGRLAQGILERPVPLSRREGHKLARRNKDYPPRDARVARLEFSATRVIVQAPSYLRATHRAQLELNLVHVVEPDPPEGEESVEWFLYTTDLIDTAEQIAQVVDDYRSRWAIEEFNKAIKTGCAYEERQFETAHALLNVLAITLPIAIELLALRSLARTNPEAPAGAVLSERQIKILRVLYPKLQSHPTAQQVLLAIASIAGHRKSNGFPGWLILYRGMSKLYTAELGWIAAQQVGVEM